MRAIFGWSINFDMKFSYNWLQSYFNEKLPASEKLAELFTFRFSEVESVEQIGTDTIFDLKVLPDRACYALSHRGVAREIAAFCRMGMVDVPFKAVTPRGSFGVDIKEPSMCARYIAASLAGVTVSDSPAWLVERLASVGQRSINMIVDIANYVMFDIGQPLHAFDADKVRGVLSVRKAREGERIVTLDGKEVVFKGSELVIADEEGPLAIAGIKGGKRAEVTKTTTKLLLESASFDASAIRRISTSIGIRTDASKRFENKVPRYLAEEGMARFIEYIVRESRGAEVTVASYVDAHGELDHGRRITISGEFISRSLGVAISPKDIEGFLGVLSIVFSKNGDVYELDIPPWRLDMTIPEDVVEEIGRLYGYENVEPKLPPRVSAPSVLKALYWHEKARDFLVSSGFSEVVTYSFRKEGVMEVVKSMASDKSFLRDDLTKNISEALSMNLAHAPLLDISQIRIFEVGKVFPKGGERTSLCIGIAQSKGFKGESVNEQIRQLRDRLVGYLGAPIATVCTIDDTGGVILLSGKPIGTINAVDGVMEIDLDTVTGVLPEPKQWDITVRKVEALYSPISLYPFIVRDVAVYVNPEDHFDGVRAIINRLEGEKKLMHVVRKPERPFDEFLNSKIGKKSLAFRLVFQSHERTLTDAEVNGEMEHLYAALKEHPGWQVR